MGDDLFASPAVCGINGSVRSGHSTGGYGISRPLACCAPAGDLPRWLTDLTQYFGCNLLYTGLLEGVDFSLAEFLGGDGKACIAEMREQKAVGFVFF